MKKIHLAILTTVFAGSLLVPVLGYAGDSAKPKPTPYPLKTCIISGDKLGGDMGDPYVYIYKDKKNKDAAEREIKFCCKSCLKDFNKDPDGYIKKIDEAAAKAKKK